MVPAPTYLMAQITDCRFTIWSARRSQCRRRRFLDQFLVATLHRAVPLTEMNHSAVLVAKDLDLDMARSLEEFLDVHIAVAERRKRLVLCQRKKLAELVGIADDPHSLAAAAAVAFDHRKAYVGGDLEGRVHIRHNTRDPGTVGTPRLPPVGAPTPCRPRGIWSRVGPMKRCCWLDRLSAIARFRQESVAWVDGIGTGGTSAAAMMFGIRCRRAALGRTDAASSSKSDHAGLAIGLAYTATVPTPSSRHARITRSAISPVGHQHLAEHQRLSLPLGLRRSGRWPH